MKVALVTGSNRGIGLEACRLLGSHGFHVIVTAREEVDRQRAHSDLAKQGITVSSFLLDVSSEESIIDLRKQIIMGFDQIDILVNNAGISNSTSIIDETLENLERIFRTNVFGAWMMVKYFADLLNKSNDPRVINVSSGYGKIINQGSGNGAYRLSKLTLNGLTLALADEFRGKIAVNAMTPGWVRTRLGGDQAPRSVTEGADTIMWLATIEPSPSGKFFRDRVEIEW